MVVLTISKGLLRKCNAVWVMCCGPGASGPQLFNFCTYNLGGGSATIGGVTGTIDCFDSSGTVAVAYMVNFSGHVMASTSALSSTGSAFTVTFITST